MTVYGLKERHMNAYPNSHFFDYETLKFFGERMSDMRIMKNTTTIEQNEKKHECYVLSVRQFKNPNGPARAYFYFDTSTYELVNP